MFPLAAWEFFSVMVSFPLLAASTAKMFSVDSFTTVSFACFSARSFVNFSSEDSKPLISINVMFSIRVQVASSAAWLIGSQDAHIKVNARRASIISQSACSQNFEKPKWLSQNTLYSHIQLLCCTIACVSGLTTKFVWAFFRDEVEHLLKGLQMPVAQLPLIHPLFFLLFFFIVFMKREVHMNQGRRHRSRQLQMTMFLSERAFAHQW